MQQRTKRLLGMIAWNILLFTGLFILLAISISVITILVKLAVVAWGSKAGLAVVGLILLGIAVIGMAILKATEELRLAEFKEERLMSKLKEETVTDKPAWRKRPVY